MIDREAQREYQRKYRATHKKDRRLYMKLYKQEHKEELKASRVLYKEKKKEYDKIYRITHKEERRRATLKRNYNLTPEKWLEMYEKQEGKCAICKEERKLVVDHDHKTGKVRGLLCTKCNPYLDWFIEHKKQAEEYMERTK